MTRILITGRSGQLGAALLRRLSPSNEVYATSRENLDLTRGSAIRDLVREFRPSIIINAAAYTKVDAAESDEAHAFAINAAAPGIMAEEAARCGALLVHYSTDYVYAGHSQLPYREVDPPEPANCYGASKLAGERVVADAGASHLIFRTGWLYSLTGANFLNTIRRLLAQDGDLRIVADQFGGPTWCGTVADSTVEIITPWITNDEHSERLRAERQGLFHLTCGGETSWFSFAQAIASELEPGSVQRIRAITTSEYPTTAKRPRYTVLDNSKLRAVTGIEQTDWRDALRRCLAGGDE